jgi:sterol desaturase/sphingolipid hydroxylase (fatty acid hydroxylase superfamily)
VGDIAIPYLFAALMALEFGYNAIRRKPYQSPRDSAVSLMVAIPHFALLSIVPVVWVVAYRHVEAAMPGQLALGWWAWPLGIVVMDFAAYWMHRYHHALNVTWGIHSVHHSSDEFTMTTGGRSSLAEPFVNVISGAYLILVLPAVMGLPVAAAGLGWLVKDVWGFAVHTRNIDKLGPLELVLATPSHHRVHHAINPIYLGKNFGFVFIFWDKLFGTFQPELAAVPPIFGTTRPPRSFHPLKVAFHELAAIWRDAVATRRWRDKLRIWFMPAGWRPDDAIALPQGAELPRPHVRYTPPAPRALYVVGGFQLSYLLLAMVHLAMTLGDHGLAPDLGYLGFLILGTAILGDFFECAPRYPVVETARAAGLVGMLVVTGTWFGRPVDPFVLVLLAGAGVNLAISWLARGRVTVSA